MSTDEPLYAWQVHAFYLSNPELTAYLTLGAKTYLLIKWPPTNC